MVGPLKSGELLPNALLRAESTLSMCNVEEKDTSRINSIQKGNGAAKSNSINARNTRNAQVVYQMKAREKQGQKSAKKLTGETRRIALSESSS